MGSTSVGDGTAAGTKVIVALGSAVYDSDAAGTLPALLAFTVETGELGEELWVSDGTRRGTHVVRDIIPRPRGSSPGNFAVVGGGMSGQ